MIIVDKRTKYNSNNKKDDNYDIANEVYFIPSVFIYSRGESSKFKVAFWRSKLQGCLFNVHDFKSIKFLIGCFGFVNTTARI